MRRYNNFLLEKKKEEDKKEEGKKYEYGCAMLYFDFPDMKKIHDLIDEDDIYDEDGFGLEKEPHLTLLYGFHYEDVEEKEVFDTILDFDVSELELYNVSSFENKDMEYDVLKFDVREKMDEYKKKDDVLYNINKELVDKFPYTTDYPDYHPHSTITYLKKGKAKKYIKELKDEVYTVKGKKLVYSIPNKDQTGTIKNSKKIGK